MKGNKKVLKLLCVGVCARACVCVYLLIAAWSPFQLLNSWPFSMEHGMNLMRLTEDPNVVILTSVQAGNTNLEKYEIVRLERQKRD